MKNPKFTFFVESAKAGLIKKDIRKAIVNPEKLERTTKPLCSDLMRQTQSLDACLDSIWRRCT